MNAKQLILAAKIAASSIFWWPREGRDAFDQESNTGQSKRVLGCRALAVAHWRYVEGVLLRHGVPADEVSLIGEAYLAGFLRGWALAWYSRLFSVSCDSAARWELARWSSSREGYPVECAEHFQEAFVHSWKHRLEDDA